jgi:glycosyltransferase involved in cell wall biosynthesis
MVQRSRVSTKKIVVIENAVDVDYFAPNAEEKSTGPGGQTVRIIGTVARLSPEKDFGLFFETARAIIRKQENTDFVIVGDGGLRSALEDSAADPEFGGRVKLVGARSDVPTLMKTFNLFLFTSRIEAFGLTVLESLACGIPVVAAQPELGAAAKIFEKLPGVVLVRDRDPLALAEECLSLLNDPDRMIKARQSGREYVATHYGLMNYARSVDGLYQTLWNARRT